MKNKITDIAKMLKISPATVSRVFNKHPYVNEDIRKRVLETARKVNYAPKSNSNKNTFGIMVSGTDGISISTPYETQLVFSISKMLFNEGFAVQIFSFQSIPYLHSNSVRALIVLSSVIPDELLQVGFPVVSVNNPHEKTYSVFTDHAEGARMAVDYLAGKGHKRIAFISGKSNCWGNTERENGYREGVRKNSLDVEDALLKKADNEKLLEAIACIMKEEPTALIVAGEGKGLVVNHSLYLLDKRIPDDISIITYEDNIISPYLQPPHTTISQNLDILGAKAAEMAIAAANEGKYDAPFSVSLENTIIERSSVKNILP
ncbi:MAG: hypothetical protein A2017_09655 [Lentisphaerae bacterium GWF2_44_16]|nr:MAG: hypothetical protein A2017_09655 [Lentisphaerae bacterium GWF2_44_16]